MSIRRFLANHYKHGVSRRVLPAVARQSRRRSDLCDPGGMDSPEGVAAGGSATGRIFSGGREHLSPCGALVRTHSTPDAGSGVQGQSPAEIPSVRPQGVTSGIELLLVTSRRACAIMSDRGTQAGSGVAALGQSAPAGSCRRDEEANGSTGTEVRNGGNNRNT